MYNNKKDGNGRSKHSREIFQKIINKKIIIPKNETLKGVWFVVSVNTALQERCRLVALSDKAYYHVKYGKKLKKIYHYKRIGLEDICSVQLGKIISSKKSGRHKEYGVKITTTKYQHFFKHARLYSKEDPHKDYMVEFVLKLIGARSLQNSHSQLVGALQTIPGNFRESLQTIPGNIGESLQTIPGNVGESLGNHVRHSVYLSGIFSPEDLETYDVELSRKSSVVSEHNLQKILRQIPEKYRLYTWQKVFSTNQDGTSLQTFYNNLHKKGGYNCPSIILVEDEMHTVFGGFVTDTWRISGTAYGTGESFLFKFKNSMINPDLEIYRWSKSNNSYQMGFSDAIAIGCGHEGFGLWISDDFLHGHSNKSETFQNPPLACEIDFKILNVEVWTPCFN